MNRFVEGRITLGVAGEPVLLSRGLPDESDVMIGAAPLAVSRLIITANGNTSVIVIGSRDVRAAAATRRGLSLQPNERVVLPDVYLNDIWMDGLTVGDGLHFSGLVPHVSQSVSDNMVNYAGLSVT